MSELDEIRQRKLQEMMKLANSGQSGGFPYPDSPVVVTDSDFEDTVKKYPMVVVDCWAPWCGPCRMLSPTVDAMAKDLKGKVVFAKLNTDEAQAIAGRYGIRSIPTLMLFKGGEVVEMMVGALPKAQIVNKIAKHFA